MGLKALLQSLGFKSKADVTPEALAQVKQTQEAAKTERHAASRARIKQVLDPAFQAKALAYYNTLDDSHKAAFLYANEDLRFVVGKDEINRVLGNSEFQTQDGKALDPSVTEPVFQG